MSRDIWVTLVGLCIAGLALAWVLSSGGTDADASEEQTAEHKTVPAG